MSDEWITEQKMEPTQPGVTGIPAFTGSGVVILLLRPNSPAAHTFHNRRLINLDVPPFENGRPDQRRQSGYIEDIPEREIIDMPINQNVGRGEFRNDGDAIRNECKVNKISLI